ncbi:hypothetical protein J3B02_005261, partial [Coemansia erecta]
LLHLKKGVSAGPSDDSVHIEYEQLMKWTASANIFDRRYIFIPVNENIHWYLVVITNPHSLLKGAIDTELSKPISSNSEEAKLEPGESNCDSHKNNGIGVQKQENLPDEAILATTMYANRKRRADSSSDRHSQKLGQETHEKKALSRTASKTYVDTPVFSTEGAIKAQRDVASSPIMSIAQPESVHADSSLAVDDEDNVFLNRDGVKIRKHSSSSYALPSEVIDLCSPQQTRALVDNGVAVDLLGIREKDPETVLLKFMDKEIQVPESRYVDPLEKPGILILDSLGNKHQRTITLLRSYMKAEAISRHGVVPSVIPVGKYVKVPLQGNLCDCGVFLLNYIELFLEQPKEITELALNGVDLRKWFVPATMKGKRKDIFTLVSGLAEQGNRKKEELKLGKEDDSIVTT